MISVACCHVETGKVVVHVPLKYRSLIEKYAEYGEGYVTAFGTDRFDANGWFSKVPYTLWIQLPGVVVEKW